MNECVMDILYDNSGKIGRHLNKVTHVWDP